MPLVVVYRVELSSHVGYEEKWEHQRIASAACWDAVAGC